MASRNLSETTTSITEQEEQKSVDKKSAIKYRNINNAQI